MHSNKQQGFTLVELMVALTLGLILAVLAGSLYVGQSQTTRLSRQFAHLQEDGSRALDAMARDLRGAGDYGCFQVTPDSNPFISDIRTNTANFSSAWPGVRGFSTTAEIANSGLPNATAISNIASLDAGKVIAITGVLDTMQPLTASASITGALAVGKGDFAGGDDVVISDCLNITLLNVKTYSEDAGITHDANLITIYPKNTQVGRISTVWWLHGTPITGWPKGLYRIDATRMNTETGAGFELISQISHDLDFSYSSYTTDANGNNVIQNADVNASTIGSTMGDWFKVRKLKVNLLVKSEKPNSEIYQKYYFKGQSVTATDKYSYFPLQIATNLRNLGLAK